MSGPLAKTCWIATDGATGNEKQCLALAHYLEVEPEIFRIRLRQPWDLFSPHLRWAGRHALSGDIGGRLNGPLPDLLITAGRRSAVAALTIKRLSRGRTFSVQVLNPRIRPSLFDLVICPRHDRLSGANVINTLGALHEVDEETLEQARGQWADHFRALPAPRIAVLIGASNRAYTIDEPYLERLAILAEGWLGDEGGSVMVTTSRRTPASLQSFARQRFGHLPGVVWTGRESTENPYLGFLAWADRIIVSADTVNMVSEACGTGKPVYCSAPPSGNLRFARFHATLREAGMIVPLDHSGQTPDYRPLRETRDVARKLADRLQWP